MSDASIPIPDLAPLLAGTTFPGLPERPSATAPQSLPPVDLPTTAVPGRPPVPPPSTFTTTLLRDDFASAADTSRPATLPLVDWAFVAAIPEPPRRHPGADAADPATVPTIAGPPRG